MIQKQKLLIASLLITIGLFVYLSFHHYSVRLGLGGSTLCEVSSTINCDAAATSSFSEFFGVPIAILGGVFTLALLCFVAFNLLGWVESTRYLRNTLRTLLIVAVLTSLISGIYSIYILKVICPFCVGTYIFSVFNLILGWNIVDEETHDFKLTGYFNEYKSHLIALACIPFFSWAISGMIQSNYGLDKINARLPEFLAQWSSGKEYKFSTQIGLSNKVENPKIQIVEFADFKCPHCRVASKTIELFLKGHPDVQFIFKPYPLDGLCNPEVEHKGDGSRCQLAAFTLCADKLANKGWELHHWIFEKQESLARINDVKTLLPDIQKDLNLDEKQMSDCSDSTEILELIRKSSQEGGLAKVQGTPAIFVNGRYLPWGHYLGTLKAVYGK